MKSEVEKQRLMRSTMSEGKRRAQIYGLSYIPNGILSDIELREVCRPVDKTTHDAQHVIFGNGVANAEVSALLHKLFAVSNISFADIRDDLGSDWTQPFSVRVTNPN